MLVDDVARLPPVERLLTGVYQIKNLVNGKVYVGSAAVRFSARWGHHRSCLRKGLHPNRHLQSAWNLYGEDNFEFSVLERCRPEDCISIEQKWIKKLMATDPRRGYNKYPEARSPRGIKRPPSVGIAVAAANAKRVVSMETRQKMSDARRGRPFPFRVDGQFNGRAKLTPAKVRLIRRMAAKGSTISYIARKMGMGRSAIGRIVSGKGWTNVD